MRYANEATFDVVADVASGFTRIDWVNKFEYPAPRTFTFTEIVASDVGYVSGIDSNGRTKQSLDSNPPAHNMSGLRLAATQRELRRNATLLLLEMYRNPAADYIVPNVTVGGVSYPTVEYPPERYHRAPGDTRNGRRTMVLRCLCARTARAGVKLQQHVPASAADGAALRKPVGHVRFRHGAPGAHPLVRLRQYLGRRHLRPRPLRLEDL